MKRRTFLAAISAAAVGAAAGARASVPDDNPLLQPWQGPFGGVPPFDKIKVEHFPSAFQASMNEYRAEIAKIADNPAAANFANTLAALEDAGRTFSRVNAVFDIFTSTANTAEVQKIDRDWKPKLAAFSDEITQNANLFKRIETVYEARMKSGLTAEQQRLAWHYYKRFVREGARLSAADKKQLSVYNQRLAGLYTKFSQNQLHDEETYRLVLESEKDLAGLPAWLRESAAASAKEKGLNGKWAIANTRSAMEPFLTYSERRDLREKAFKMWTQRGDMAGDHDNNPVVTEILQLRAKRAKLLGYKTFAHWQIEEVMAGTPERAMDLMMQVWPAAVKRVHEEVADMQALALKEGAKLTIEPWDYRFYAEKVRKARYDLDENEIKPYLQLEKLREAVFWASGQLFGMQYKQVDGIPTIQPDVRTYSVSTADGKLIGLWYWDPYARDGKSSGAWMNEYREQENFRKPITPIVSNNSNFVKGAAGTPVLVSWDDASTTFHEFGHAIHGLSSQVSYPSLSGTNVPRDFVEFPSQLNEHWLSTPEVLKRFAIHYQTGKPMPPELVAKIRRAETFNQGFQTVEYLASAIVDLKLHLAGDVPIEPRVFEQESLAALGMPKEITMRHRIPAFGHIFSDDGYAAGYYAYLWSEVLDHDAFEAFKEAGGPYDKKVAKRYHDNILQVGNTIDPAVAYRNFRGKDPSIGPLLRYRGFPT